MRLCGDEFGLLVLADPRVLPETFTNESAFNEHLDSVMQPLTDIWDKISLPKTVEVRSGLKRPDYQNMVIEVCEGIVISQM